VSLAKRPEAIEKAQAFLNKGAGKENYGNTIKANIKKAKNILDSIIEWVQYKYRLIAFGIRNIKHLKKWL